MEVEADPNPPVHVSDDVGYRQTRRNVAALLRERPQTWSLPVPACPQWSVRDTVEHVTGVCRSVEGKLPGGCAGPPSIAEFDVAGLLAEWDRSGERVDRLLAGRPGPGPLLMDAFTHELDLTLALGAPPPAGHPAYPGAVQVALGGFSGSVAAHGLPALRIEAAGSAWIAGEGRPAAVVGGGRLDVFRSFVGRRTHAQIARLDWSGDPGPWLPAFTWGSFRPPEAAVE